MRRSTQWMGLRYGLDLSIVHAHAYGRCTRLESMVKHGVRLMADAAVVERGRCLGCSVRVDRCPRE